MSNFWGSYQPVRGWTGLQMVYAPAFASLSHRRKKVMPLAKVGITHKQKPCLCKGITKKAVLQKARPYSVIWRDL